MSPQLDSLLKEMSARYPSVGTHKDKQGLRESVGPLFSDHTVELPFAVFEKIQKTVRDLYAYGKSPDYKEWLSASLAAKGHHGEVEILNLPVKNHSILMAYDFHYEPESNQLSLIEINTNASGYMFSDLIYRAHGYKFAGAEGDALDLFLQSVENESRLALGKKPAQIAIIDENVTQQKMYLEFLMYRDLFNQSGYKAEIFESGDVHLNGEFEFIYNRDTDFTFKEPRSNHLHSALLKGDICFSPHPREYLLLGHKERLIHFAEKGISDTLIPTFLLDENTDHEELWDRRKNLFFKPRALFGGKATYKGSSISRKMFEKLFEAESPAYLAQEFRPAGAIKGYKFDLRFYVYENKVHNGIARVYQGQVTNFNTPGGGFAPIKLI